MRFLKIATTLLGLCLVGMNAAGAETRKIDIVGTGDGIDVLRAVAASFMQQEKTATQIEISPSIGSGGGIAAVGSGKAILGRVARRLTDAEIASGIVYKPIARLPSAFIVHPSCGVKAVTSDQLVAIYSGRLTNWKEIGGADLRIRVVRREDQDSTLTILRASMPGWNDLVITDKSKMATTTQEAIETVRDVQGAIGFGPFSRPLEQGLTVLRVNGHYPTDVDYPSSNVLALIYLKTLQDADALAFIRFADSPEAAEVITRLGSLPAKP
jgi:phosphate transport system substrate-binding protein